MTYLNAVVLVVVVFGDSIVALDRMTADVVVAGCCEDNSVVDIGMHYGCRIVVVVVVVAETGGSNSIVAVGGCCIHSDCRVVIVVQTLGSYFGVDDCLDSVVMLNSRTHHNTLVKSWCSGIDTVVYCWIELVVSNQLKEVFLESGGYSLWIGFVCFCFFCGWDSRLTGDLY